MSREEMQQEVEADTCAFEPEAGPASGCGGSEELPWSAGEELLDEGGRPLGEAPRARPGWGCWARRAPSRCAGRWATAARSRGDPTPTWACSCPGSRERGLRAFSRTFSFTSGCFQAPPAVKRTSD